MKQEKLKKPENYTEGGSKEITKNFLNSLPQLIFVISLIIWLVCSFYVSIEDIITDGFDHKVLSYSFIGGILTSGYMVVTNYITKKKLGGKKPKPTKKCNSCGKNTTKK
jgi:hypothetical protein